MMSRSSVRDPVLYAAWREYSEAAFRVLAEHGDRVDPEELYEEVSEWRPRSRAGDPWWRRRTKRRPWLWPLISELEEQLLALPGYGLTLAALRGNEVMAPQVGAGVGTVLSSSLLAENELIEGILQEMALRMPEISSDEEDLGAAFPFNEGVFGAAYEHIEAALYATDLEFKMIAPVFQASFERLPLALGGDLRLDIMTTAELNAVASAGLMAREVRPDEDKHVFSHRVAVIYRYRLPKQVGAREMTEEEQAEHERSAEAEVDRLFNMTEQITGDVLQALRLVHQGAFSIPGAVQVPVTWFEEDQEPRCDWLETGSRHYPMTAQFSDSACDDVGYFYGALNERRVQHHKGLLQAVRRFSYAMDKHRDEDRILDVMIAAEALFLSDTGDARDKGELKYRLSLRAAFFLGSDGREREEVFRFMKLAYDARSSIAHGGTPDKLRDPKGVDVDLYLFTRHLERYLRRALRKAVREAPGKGPLVDWEGRILAGDESREG